MVRPWLLNLNKRYWAEGYASAIYVKNWLPQLAVKDKTPYEAFYGLKPTISHLQLFGRTCYVHISEERQPPGSKLNLCTEKEFFFRYIDSPLIYKVYIPACKHTYIISALDVKFDHKLSYLE